MESEELKAYREKRIKHFKWIMENLVEVERAYNENTGFVPRDTLDILRRKLHKELYHFRMQSKKDENERFKEYEDCNMQSN